MKRRNFMTTTTLGAAAGSCNCKGKNLDTLIESGQVSLFTDKRQVKLNNDEIKVKAFRTSIILNNMLRLDAG